GAQEVAARIQAEQSIFSPLIGGCGLDGLLNPARWRVKRSRYFHRNFHGREAIVCLYLSADCSHGHEQKDQAAESLIGGQKDRRSRDVGFLLSILAGCKSSCTGEEPVGAQRQIGKCKPSTGVCHYATKLSCIG